MEGASHCGYLVFCIKGHQEIFCTPVRTPLRTKKFLIRFSLLSLILKSIIIVRSYANGKY